MRIKSYLSGIILWCLILTSCSQKSDTDPIIKMVSPDIFSEQNINQDFVVEVKMWDDVWLDSYEILLKSENGLVFFQAKESLDVQEQIIKYRFDLSDSIGSKIQLLIHVSDVDGNVATYDTWVITQA